jgi:hypothetical protein
MASRKPSYLGAGIAVVFGGERQQRSHLVKREAQLAGPPYKH